MSSKSKKKNLNNAVAKNVLAKSFSESLNALDFQRKDFLGRTQEQALEDDRRSIERFKALQAETDKLKESLSLNQRVYLKNCVATAFLSDILVDVDTKIKSISPDRECVTVDILAVTSDIEGVNYPTATDEYKVGQELQLLFSSLKQHTSKTGNVYWSTRSPGLLKYYGI